MGSSANTPRCCGNCATPMRVLKLPAHNRGEVEIDVCEPCTLIWFDGFESSKLAGPGLVGLVQFIHSTLQRNASQQALPPGLTCQVCATPLKRVFNMSRFGRTMQLECPNKHGAYQSFQLFLAEKGFFRPYTWQDIKQLSAEGKRVQCFQCGATLELRPQEACPYCATPVGLIDPARLASAIDIHQDAGPVQVAAKANQSTCPACGGAVDLTQDISCHHCQAILPAPHTADAQAVTEVLADTVWEEHVNPTPQLVREQRAGVPHLGFSDGTSESLIGSTAVQFRVMGGLLVLALVGVLFYKVIMPAMGWGIEPYKMSEAEYDAMILARIQSRPEFANVDHAPDGTDPPQTGLLRDRANILIVSNRSGRTISVSIKLALQVGKHRWLRCPMKTTDANGNDLEETVMSGTVFRRYGFYARGCQAEVLQAGRPELVIKDAQSQRLLFVSDSALFD